MNIVASGLQFPEGPIAMPDGSVLLVEIARETVSRVYRDGRIEVVAKVKGGPNGLAFGPDECVYVCNNGGFSWIKENGTHRPHLQPADYLGGSIEVLDPASGKLERLYSACDGVALRGPNDLVFDRNGDFWFTDLGKRRERDLDRGFIYWARADGSEIRQVIGPIFTPNGIGLSPDEATLYVAETETGRLWAWDVTGPGTLRQMPWPSPHGGRLVHGAGGFVRFDSLAVSASGRICVAALQSGSIVEIWPDGSRAVHHPMPDLGVTNICFGGAGMRTAFVTLSHEGRLGAMEWHEPGLRLNYQP